MGPQVNDDDKATRTAPLLRGSLCLMSAPTILRHTTPRTASGTPLRTLDLSLLRFLVENLEERGNAELSGRTRGDSGVRRAVEAKQANEQTSLRGPLCEHSEPLLCALILQSHLLNLGLGELGLWHSCTNTVADTSTSTRSTASSTASSTATAWRCPSGSTSRCRGVAPAAATPAAAVGSPARCTWRCGAAAGGG